MSGAAWSTEGRRADRAALRSALRRARRLGHDGMRWGCAGRRWGSTSRRRRRVAYGRSVAVRLDARRRLAEPVPAGVAGAAIRGARWRGLRLAYARALAQGRTKPDRLRALRRTLLTHVPIPLCEACRAWTAGAFGGPDAPWRPAVAPERCAAQDHE